MDVFGGRFWEEKRFFAKWLGRGLWMIPEWINEWSRVNPLRKTPCTATSNTSTSTATSNASTSTSTSNTSTGTVTSNTSTSTWRF